MISFIIPVKDEAPTLETLCEEVTRVADRESLACELVFIDDGSSDDSWAKVQAMAARDRRVRGIRFRRNAGKAAALSAGFTAAVGTTIITLDADLQDDPQEVPRFLQALDQGADMVSGWKRKRHDPWHKVWPSHVFNRMIGWFTGLHLHDNVCGFKALRADIARHVDLYGEMHRFFAVRAHALGYKVVEIEVHHRPRTHGRSKYGISRNVKGFFDLLTVWFTLRYGRRPLHFFGTIGGALLAAGLIGATIAAIRGTFLAGTMWTWIIAGLFGSPWLAFGLLAEANLALRRERTPDYVVAERVGFGASGAASDAQRDLQHAGEPGHGA